MGQAEQANLLGRWYDDDLIGSNAFNNIYNEIWGVKAGDREFAVIGSTAGTHFIDVTDPGSLVYTNFVPGAVSGGQIIHRDFHDYAGYLYIVADEGASTLQIVDISNLPFTAPVVYESGELIQRTHNIFIDEENARMYAFHTTGTSVGYEAMRIFDLTDPVFPVLLAGYGAFDGIDFGHVHDGYVRDNIAFLNCGGDGLFIVDFTDVQSPQLLKHIGEYPDKGYNHSGWLTDDGHYYYMADENHAFRLKAVDVNNPCEAEVSGTFDADVENPFAITHNQIVACDYLYTSYYYDGLQVFDISDRENPEKVLQYDTYSGQDEQSYKGAWGIYPLLPSGLILLSDMQEGLFVFEGVGDDCHNTKDLRPLDDPCNPQFPTPVLDQEMVNGIFPQPVRAGGSLRVELSGQGEADIQLLGTDGRLVRTWSRLPEPSGNIYLDLSQNMAPGIYVLQVELQGARQTHRLVVTD
jgi:choice-of-anchor B domain-containing protein